MAETHHWRIVGIEKGTNMMSSILNSLYRSGVHEGEEGKTMGNAVVEK